MTTVQRAMEQDRADVLFKLAHGQRAADTSAWNPLLASHTERALRSLRETGEAA